MALDPTALLVLVETAITALIAGEHSSYSIGSRSVTKLDLPQLFAERRLLQDEVNKASSSSGVLRYAKLGRAGQ